MLILSVLTVVLVMLLDLHFEHLSRSNRETIRRIANSNNYHRPSWFVAPPPYQVASLATIRPRPLVTPYPSSVSLSERFR